MSEEVKAIVRELDSGQVETQLALQCAPLIAGLKISNLLIIEKSNLPYMNYILQGTGISAYVLQVNVERIIILLYRKEPLASYMKQRESQRLLEQMGYSSVCLGDILPEFRRRYQYYLETKQHFPHEMGLLLGYPIEDVEGFIHNAGENCLAAGYWKVYGNLKEKRQMFREFELAQEAIFQMISGGTRIEDVIRRYNPL